MEDELLCGVCREVYMAGQREPVVLPSCGHAFCRNCLLKLEKDSCALGSCLSCPTCRTPHQNPSVYALPPVFALLHLSENSKKCLTDGESRCSSHGSKVEFWCCNCHTVLCGHCLLEGHVKEGHDVQTARNFVNNQRRDVKTTGAWLKWELEQRQRTLLREMTTLVTRLVCIAHQSHILQDSGDRVAKILEETGQTTTIEGILLVSTLMGSLESEVRNSLSRETNVASRTLLRCRSCTEATIPTTSPVRRHESISEADWREAPVEEATGQEDSGEANVPAAVAGEETMLAETTLRQEEVEVGTGSGEDGFQGLFGEENDAGVSEDVASKKSDWAWPLQCMVTVGDGRHGRLCWENGRVHAYALARDDKTRHLLIQLPFLRSLGHDAQPEVFLDLATEERLLGRVYIKLWGHLRRAHHFLSLCMGTYGPSYRGSKFHGVAKKGCMGETLAGGRYLTDNGDDSVQGLFAGLEWGGQHLREKMVGLVVAASDGNPEQDAFFHICTRDHPGRKFACAFGEVCSGMEAVHAAVAVHPAHGVKIADCGLVLPRMPGVRDDGDIYP